MTTQTDPNAAYNAKVREIAEELARCTFNRRFNISWDSLTDEERSGWLSYEYESARAMVAKMAQYYQEGYMSNCPDNEESSIWHAWFENATDECIERGLIPAITDTKTDDNGVR